MYHLINFFTDFFTDSSRNAYLKSYNILKFLRRFFEEFHQKFLQTCFKKCLLGNCSKISCKISWDSFTNFAKDWQDISPRLIPTFYQFRRVFLYVIIIIPRISSENFHLISSECSLNSFRYYYRNSYWYSSRDFYRNPTREFSS